MRGGETPLQNPERKLTKNETYRNRLINQLNWKKMTDNEKDDLDIIKNFAGNKGYFPISKQTRQRITPVLKNKGEITYSLTPPVKQKVLGQLKTILEKIKTDKESARKAKEAANAAARSAQEAANKEAKRVQEQKKEANARKAQEQEAKDRIRKIEENSANRAKKYEETTTSVQPSSGIFETLKSAVGLKQNPTSATNAAANAKIENLKKLIPQAEQLAEQLKTAAEDAKATIAPSTTSTTSGGGKRRNRRTRRK